MTYQKLTKHDKHQILPSLENILDAQQNIYPHLHPTPQYTWPLLNQELSMSVWVKHENQLPTSAFKIRGGLNYFHYLNQEQPSIKKVVSATRGNHGQSIAMAAGLYNVEATIVVPKGNSLEKNNAMRAFGATLIEHGDDFQAARVHAAKLANEGYHFIPSFDKKLVAGVATCWLEFFTQHPDLDAVLIPIGLGSGIVAAIAARQALGLSIKIYGVVSTHANAYQQSFRQARLMTSPSNTAIADGVAVSTPDPEALDVMLTHLEDVLDVNDQEVSTAIKLYYRCLHQVAEGAAAVPLAALCKYRQAFEHKKIGIPLTGSNIDTQVLAKLLQDSNY